MLQPDYERSETRAHQLDRNWAELLQELRVIGAGVQVLFAFLLSIAFQARFVDATSFERAVYLVTLLLSALSTALMIAPVAIHRFLFGYRLKDEVVAITNVLAITGLVVLSLAMSGGILLVSDWVAGTTVAIACSVAALATLTFGWIAVPLWLRARHRRAV